MRVSVGVAHKGVWHMEWRWCCSNLLVSNMDPLWMQHPCVVCCQVVIISDGGGRHRCLMLCWLSTAQLFKQGIQGTHSFASYIYQIRRRMICKWDSFHGTMGGKKYVKRCKYLNTNNHTGTHYMINRRRGFVRLLPIFRCSIVSPWFLETLCCNTPQPNFISSFPHHIRSMKIPLEMLMCVAQLSKLPRRLKTRESPPFANKYTAVEQPIVPIYI